MDFKLPPVLQGIATTTPDGDLHLLATRHPVPLDALPLARWTGLPVTGAFELDIDLRVPRTAGQLDAPQAHGTAALRSTARCRVGDDATPIKHPRLDAFFPGGLPFTHLDLDSIAVELTVDAGVARLTRFEVASPDLHLQLELAVTLAAHFPSSTLDGVVRFRLSDAFAQREPLLSAGLSLFNLSRDPTGLATLPFAGPLSSPHIVPAKR